MKTNKKIPDEDIPDIVITSLEDVRQSGKCNMFDSTCVMRQLFDREHYEAVTWLWDKNWKEGSFRSQVDSVKYHAALMLLGEINAVADKLAGKE